jgi:hypothetical protein
LCSEKVKEGFMGLGFSCDTLQNGDQQFYLLIRPLDVFMLEHSGHVESKDISTSWTPYSAEWSINNGYLHLTRFSRGSVENHFEGEIPNQLVPLLQGSLEGVKADWFTGFIPVYTQYDIFGSPSFTMDSLPLIEFEYLLVFKNGKYINTIKNCHYIAAGERLTSGINWGEYEKMHLPPTRKEYDKQERLHTLMMRYID